MLEPFKQGPTFSVIRALGVDGLRAPFLIEGAINAEVFTRYVEQFLVSWLRPGQQVWLDNVKFHYAPKASAALEATGARVCHLPPTPPTSTPWRRASPNSRRGYGRPRRGPPAP
jgi:hypothetical protein